MARLGAHQSITGGYYKAFERINSIGGNCLQIFSGSPRGWNFVKINEKERELFINHKSKFDIHPIYFQASYLINLADESRIGHLSKMSLIAEMNIASKLDIKGSIVHLGSFKHSNNFRHDRNQSCNYKTNKYIILIKNIKEILGSTPKNTLLIIENSGNRKIGQSLEEISHIIKDIDDARVRLCLDTCHLFSNGYKFENKKELEEFVEKLSSLQLINKLECWHLNDSRDSFNSGHDRHENIGKGTIGLKEFEILINHSETKNYPFIIETPGFDHKGPDKKNLDILKNLITKN